MLEFRNPLPVKTELGEGYALYVTNGGGMANDTFCVALDDGRLRHFTTEQLRCVPNGTLGIQPGPALPQVLHYAPNRREESFDVACGAKFIPAVETTADAERITCVACHRICDRPDSRNDKPPPSMYSKRG